LALLPLHVVSYSLGGRKTNLLDEVTVTYVPNARALTTAQREADRRRGEPSLLGVGNPLAPHAVVEWAQTELDKILPDLRAVVQDLRDQRLPKEVGIPAALVALYELTLEQLETVVREPNRLMQSGSIFQQAAALFGLLHQRPHATALQAIASRIVPNLAFAKAEILSIVGLFPPEAPTSLFFEREATREAVLNAMSSSRLVHLSCHGIFKAEDPLESSLIMSDGHLSLRDILSMDHHALDAVRLVILSACQTALIDFSRLPDEIISLATGFL
jgi:CHAT domain-containing protein